MSDLIEISLHHPLACGDGISLFHLGFEPFTIQHKCIDAHQEEDLRAVIIPKGQCVAGIGYFGDNAIAGGEDVSVLRHDPDAAADNA